MNSTNVDQLVGVIHGQLILGDGRSCLNGVSIDTRTIEHGQAFFAIVGENFDGHDYIGSAIEKGAACIIADHLVDMPLGPKIPLVQVKDTIGSLAQFASWYRQQLSTKVIAITGSVGKTTTRHILHQILSRFFKCRQAPGSFNNHIGVPLTLLSAEPDDEILLVEIGSNHLGEIERLTLLAKPDIAVITAVAPSHLDGFGSLENIIMEKASIAQGLQTDGVLHVNGDHPDLLAYIKKHYEISITAFGEKDHCEVRGTDLVTTGSEGSLIIDGQCIPVPLPGKANLSNVLTAWSVCRDLVISLSDFADSVQSLKPEKMRLEIEEIGPITIINDCYNANPISMANGLSCLASMASGTNKRKVFIAGSMAELGLQSESLHIQLGQEAVSQGVQLLLAVGPFAQQILKGATGDTIDSGMMHAFNKTEQLCDNLHKWIQPDDIILVKGSRSASLEKAVQCLIKLFGNQ